MKQQGVSYSINYVFTCGQRRVRICRNIYDQTNNTDYLVEEGSKGLGGGMRKEESGKQCLLQKSGVKEGQKKDANGLGGNGIQELKWVISSQKQLLLVGTNNQGDKEEMGHHQNQMEVEQKNKKTGGCMKNYGQNLKKCQCIECISYLDQSKFNLSSSSSSSTSSSFQEGKENSSSNHISSTQNLRVVTDFYLHKISEVNGVLQSYLLLRVEDTFFDLNESNSTLLGNNMNKSPAKNYIYNRKILNGFLFKQAGLYMQFASQISQPQEAGKPKNSSYYPNSTDLSLKNENFKFRFVITQTDEGFSVDGALVSNSPLIQVQEKLAYNVSILQEEQPKNNLQQSNQIYECSKSIDIVQENLVQAEVIEDEDDTQSSSLTIQINNNRQEYQDEIDSNEQKKNKESSKKSSAQKTPKLSNLDKKQMKSNKKQSTIQVSEEDEIQPKKLASASKKQLSRSSKSVQSTNWYDDQELMKDSKQVASNKFSTHSKTYYLSDEVDDDQDNDQHSWDTQSKESSNQYNRSNHKSFHHQSHNDELNSSNNQNSPVQPKKNVVKNFVKAFRNFVNNWGDEGRIMKALGVTTNEELQNFRLEYKRFESIHKFNNTFIKALILNEPFKPVFNYFVNEEAWEWLDKSQVNNKKAHKDVLRDYMKATQDPLRIEEIHSLRTRNRQSSKKIKSL